MSVFSTLLIGNESLTQQCGMQLLARGHRISAVMTRHPEVAKWAAAAGLPVVAAGDWAGLGTAQVDWILSVANLAVIPAQILALAVKGAVNFHDGPLPRYAGLNAPVWAILNDERTHGITWHLMERGVDEGDILEQRLFDLAEDETAFTLNSRCFEAALDSFPALMTQLETGLRRQKQDLAARSTFARADRPAAMGRLDFSQPAEGVARMVRALDHGPYWNPVTTAKIQTPAGVMNVGAAQVVDGSGVPGQVLSFDADGLVVACATGAVRLSRLQRDVAAMEAQAKRMSDSLDVLTASFNKEQATLVGPPRDARLKAITARQAAYQERFQDLQSQAQEREAEVMQPILDQIKLVLEDLRQEGGYTMIFDVSQGGAIVAADKNLNVSDRVLAKLRTMPLPTVVAPASAASKAAPPSAPAGAPVSAPAGVRAPGSPPPAAAKRPDSTAKADSIARKKVDTSGTGRPPTTR